MSDYFKENNSLLSLSIHTALRRPQIAATWALASRALDGADASQAILPTGVGKTAVITALPLAIAATRVLVIVPSNIVRRQVAHEFNTFRTLKASKAVPKTIPRATVKALKHGMRSSEAWDDLSAYDVIIATPQCVSSGYKGIVPPPKGFFDLLVIDEAHHAAARTWNKVIDDLSGTPAALLTATPFRRDKKRLPGEICYVYTLAEAIRANIYSPIELVAVDPVPGQQKDLTLASAARDRLQLPEHVRVNSQLLVRTDRIPDAHRLREIYRQVGLKLPVLTSELSNRETDAIIADLTQGNVKGVIVVGVLTEGFDLPNLKIAVYHKKHQSFASTLQFVGRLARPVNGELAHPDLLAFTNDLTDETTELYKEDASWPELLPKIADAAVAEERVARTYLGSFEDAPEAFSLITVEPRSQVQIFELDGNLPDLTLRFDGLLLSPIEDFFNDEDQQLAAFVTRDIIHPDWLRSTALDTAAYDLHIICVDASLQYLFVQSATAASTAEIMRKYELGELRKVGPEKLNAALHTYAVNAYSMVGLRNRSPSAATGFSYKMVAGHSASEGITIADHTTTSAGHVSARYMEGNSTMTVGTSLEGGKFWESTRRSLYDFRQWCELVASRLNTKPSTNTPPSLDVSIGSTLLEYPADDVLAAVLDSRLLEGIVDPESAAISVADCSVRARATKQFVVITLAYDSTIVASARINTTGVAVDGRYKSRLALSNETLTFAGWMNRLPPMLFFADGTSSINGTISSIPQRLETLSKQSFQQWDWTGVDIRKESRPPRAGYIANIQTAVVNRIALDSPDAYVIVDDGANEIADIVVLREGAGRRVSIAFYHCKWSSEDQAGQRLVDMTEVLSQVCRSVRWAFPNLLAKRLVARLHEQPARLRNGDANKLETLLSVIDSGATLPAFTQYAVQPGLRLSGIEHWASGIALATVAANWCDSFDADLIICGA